MSTQPTEERWTVANDERGVRTLVERLRSLEPQLLVLEATGGYELLCVAALAAAGLPVVVVDLRQVRDFAKATGQLAKTDRIDAETPHDPQRHGAHGAALVPRRIERRAPSRLTFQTVANAFSYAASGIAKGVSWTCVLVG